MAINHRRTVAIPNDKIDVFNIDFIIFYVRSDYHTVCNCPFGLVYNNFSIVYQSEIVIKHAVREIQMFVWKFFSHTIIKKKTKTVVRDCISFILKDVRKGGFLP